MWVSDIDDDMLYVYERDPNSSEHGDRVPTLEIRLPNGNGDPRGIWSDGEVMWVVDNENTEIYAMHLQDFRHSGDEFGIAAPVTPTGLWTDGETMWVADAGRSDYGKLLAYNLSDGTRSSGEDVQLTNTNLEPVSMWSDGTTVWVAEDGQSNDFLYAYAMDPESDKIGQLAPYKSITLHSDNADPVGTWSDGEFIWVSDSADEKLYAYDLANRARQADRDIDLHNNNADPAGIWSDGKTVWVMDTEDKHAYAYSLNNGNRKRFREFWTVPDNDDPGIGLTGHGLRFWVADGEDEKLYAYGKLNTPPTFNETSASLKIHRLAAAGDYVGSVPQVTDPDGDTITYLLSSGGLGVFRLDYQTGEIFVRNDATGFSGGEEYTLTVSVTDSKSGLDGLDPDPDDAINVTISVTHNADPEFTTADGTVFTVAEDVEQDESIAQLGITDLDDDTLYFGYQVTPNNPFSHLQGTFMLLNGRTLDYESTNSYRIKIQISDNKDESGQEDLSWDDELDFTIEVTNVGESGEIILGSAHPQVGTEIVATLTDPDNVDLSNGNQINWVVEKSSNTTTWVETSNRDTDSTLYRYTPVTHDTAMYLRFTATYKDGYDSVNSKTIYTQTDNVVLAEPPSNSPPTFTEDPPVTRSIAENAAGGSYVGAPVTASDPDADTITYIFSNYFTVHFEGDSETGQIVLIDDASLDYEELQTHYVRVIAQDKKDRFGNSDESYDISRLVTISVTNVEEPGSVALSSDSPEVNGEMTAELSDPDGSITNLTWQWQTAASAEAVTWSDISGATSDSYTPVVGDTGKYLRVKASYDDGEGTGKEALGTSADAAVRIDNAPPTFDEGSSTTRSINENSVAGKRVGAVVAATDPNGDTLTYSLASGADADKFSIDSASGRLEVASGAVLDFETDPALDIDLQVSDGKAADHSQDDAVDATITLTINLINVDEPGSVSLSSNEPEVGTAVTATLTDPDVVNSSDWHWEKSQDGVTGWTTIPGASTEAYMPGSSDAGMYLRAMAEYTDGEGSGKSAEGMTAGTVKAPPTADTTLASLTLNGISFNFSSSSLEYSLNVPNRKKQTKVTATTTASSGVSVEITPADSKPNRNGHQVPLAVGETQISIVVSEDQGSASTTYTVLVTREAPPTQDPPQPDSPQQDPPSEGSFAEDCRNDERDGLIANCSVGKFAVVRVELDGGYTIDWSHWDSSHSNVSGYSIVQHELLYKMYYDEDRQVSTQELDNVYESCEFVNGEWTCEGRLTSNYFEDWGGNATQARELAANEDRTDWSSALDAPGRHMFDKNFVRWSGDSTDPNNEPTDVAYRVKAFEMDMYYFTMYEGSQRSDRETVLVEGANGFD